MRAEKSNTPGSSGLLENPTPVLAEVFREPSDRATLYIYIAKRQKKKQHVPGRRTPAPELLSDREQPLNLSEVESRGIAVCCGQSWVGSIILGMVVVCIFLLWGWDSGSDHLKHWWGQITELSRYTPTYGFGGGLIRRVYK